MQLVEKIDKLCKNRGISRRKLALECGIDPATISRWTKSAPSYANLSKVAAVLDVSVEYLTDGVQTDEQPLPYYLNDETREIANAVFADKDLRILFDNSRKMSPEDLKALIAVQQAILRREKDD